MLVGRSTQAALLLAMASLLLMADSTRAGPYPCRSVTYCSPAPCCRTYCYPTYCYPVNCPPIYYRPVIVSSSTSPSLPPSSSSSSSPSSPSSTGDPPSSGTIHALIALDTDETTIGPALKKDESRLKGLMSNVFPPRLAGGKAIFLTGSAITTEAVLNHCKNLKVGPNDTVFVFVGSHGAAFQGNEHTLLIGGKKLPRSELLSALKAKSPRLLVLVTDSCFGGSQRAVRDPVAAPEPEKSLIEDLFLKPKGVVDINSCAPGELAWNDQRGGILTVAFVDALWGGRKGFGNEQQAITWAKFVDKVRDDTNKAFMAYKARSDPADPGAEKLEKQASQTVHTFGPLPVAAVQSRSAEPVSSGSGRPAELVVSLPADTKVRLDDYQTTSVGTVRRYLTPPLPTGGTYHYTLTAELPRGEAPQKVVRTITVRGGETTQVTIEFPPVRLANR